jgi:hypothetical protein
MDKTIEDRQGFIEDEKEKNIPNQELLKQHEDRILELRAEKKAYADNNEYGRKNMLVEGAKKMLEEIKQYKESTKKPKGPAEFVFNRSVEAFAGVRYRAEHGGYELSNADGIKVIEVWDKIVDAVSRVYESRKYSRAKKRLPERDWQN